MSSGARTSRRPDLIKKFEETYKVKVTVTDYDSNDTALAKVRAGGHVDHAIALRRMVAFQRFELLLPPGIGRRVGNVELMIEQPSGEAGPLFGGDGAGADLAVDGLEDFIAEAVVGFFTAGDADDGRVVGEITAVPEVEQGRQQFAGRQIAGGSEDGDGSAGRTDRRRPR